MDLGCGKGFVTSLVADLSRKVTGIDHDKQAIELARSKYPKDNLEFHCVDAKEFLEKNSEKYDVLILSHILEHIDEPEVFLQSYKSFFRYIYVELPDFDGTILNHFRKDQQMRLIYSDMDHVSEFDKKELKAIFSECGIEVLQEEFIFGVQRYWCRVADMHSANEK